MHKHRCVVNHSLHFIFQCIFIELTIITHKYDVSGHFFLNDRDNLRPVPSVKIAANYVLSIGANYER